MKALVVDDSRLAQEQLSRLLAQHNVEVDCVDSGRDCLDYLQVRQMDVVFLDILMPGIDGFETLQAILADPDIAPPHVVMCSSADSQQNRTAAAQLGVHGFLPKPYTRRELGTILASLRYPSVLASAPIRDTYDAETHPASPPIKPNRTRASTSDTSGEIPQSPPETPPQKSPQKPREKLQKSPPSRYGIMTNAELLSPPLQPPIPPASKSAEKAADAIFVDPSASKLRIPTPTANSTPKRDGQNTQETITPSTAAARPITPEPAKTAPAQRDTPATTYEGFYRLREKPFSITPDARFYFSGNDHKRALNYLRYGLLQREGFILLTGTPGSGKTTLVYTLLNELARASTLITAHMVATQATETDLLAMVLSAFGLSPEGSSQAVLLHRLEQFLRSHAEQRVLLIVDEAQRLSPEAAEALRLLTNFQANHHGLLQCFLVGQEEVRQTLGTKRMDALRQRIIAACHLQPFDLGETRQYIEHRLHIAGWRNDPEFTLAAYELIQQHTDGIPRQINKLCNRILLESFLQEAHTITAELVNTVLQELQGEFFQVENRAALAAPRSTRRLVAPSEKPTEGGSNKQADQPEKLNGQEHTTRNVGSS
ncbi:MAG: Flp pilus assembly complex ATPase component TadA [Candidatus Competibacteraceae bacterium]|nr:Flp pilus assembly complex ATPase component TadA [Candidatus Competibacteraceae bacterium]MCB1812461.1 Flp pilus assembly complex ATPase component TadA [Candidatus Competibacteraceae bacterium]